MATARAKAKTAEQERTKPAPFKWDEVTNEACRLLAIGKTQEYVAVQISVPRGTIAHWAVHPEFRNEMNRLTLITGLALRSERIRLAMQIIDKKIAGSSKKDVLDWIKFLQSETDGARIDVTALLSDHQGD